MAIYETPLTAGTGRTTFTNRLKTQFLPVADDHVHTKVTLPKLIAKKGGKMGGLESLTSVRDTLPQSAGIALFEDDTLFSPRAATYFQPKLHARDLYTRLRWTGQVERSARGAGEFAWAGPRQEDLMGAVKQFEINFARMLYLGPFQPLATVASYSDTGAGTITLSGRDSRTSAADDMWKFGAHYLRKNMPIDWVNSSGSAVDLDGNPVSGATPPAEYYVLTIDNSDPTAPTITTGRSGAAANPSAAGGTDPNAEAIIIPFGSRRTNMAAGGSAAASDDVTMYAGVNGLMQMVTDSTVYAKLYDLSRTTYPSLQGLRNTFSGTLRPFSEDLIALGVDRIADDGRGEEPNILLMHRSVRREYVKESKGDRRFKEVQTEKGYGKLVFNAGGTLLDVETDRDCPPGIVFILMTKDFKWLEQKPMGPVDEGSERFVPDKDSREIIVHKSGNAMTDSPFNNGTIEDITYDTDALTT